MAKRKRLEYYSPGRVELPCALMRRIKLRRLGRAEGFTAWVVDGAVIRNEVDIDFAIGGNPARYSYVPEGEIWLEGTGDEDDMKATFMHEVGELKAMLAGDSYDRAHRRASAMERPIRQGRGRGLPKFRANPGASYFHILGFDRAGRLVTRDVQSGMFGAQRAASRMRYDVQEVVRTTIHAGGFDEWDAEPLEEYVEVVPTATDAGRASQGHFSYWISPYGEIFPVHFEGHVELENRLVKFGVVPPFDWESPDTIRGFSPALAAGWLQVSTEAGDVPTFNYMDEPTQRQLDAVFDLAQAHKAAKRPSNQHELFWRAAMKWLGAPAVTRNPDGADMGGAGHDGAEETPQEIVDHGHYGFWLSPEGACYVVEGAYGHWRVAKALRPVFYPMAKGDWSDHQRVLELHGWVKFGDLPASFGYGMGESAVFTQAQIDALFDLVGALPNARVRKRILGCLAREMRRKDEVRSNPGEPRQRIRTICMVCKGVIHAGLLDARGGVSHGVCKRCFPTWAGAMGLTPEDVREILAEVEADEAQKNPAFAPVRVFHGTASALLPVIRAGGLASELGYRAPGWYMVAEDFASAAHHAQHLDGDRGVVVELLVPTEGKRRKGRRVKMWDGFPYLWKPSALSWDGAPTRWWALRQPLPPEFIVDVHHVDEPAKRNPAEASLLRKQLLALRPQLAAAAQAVYDAWEQDEEGIDEWLGVGGICQDVADAFAGVLGAAGIDCAVRDNQGVGEQHVWAVAYDNTSAYIVDIPPGVYETGGGYNWRKREGVEFEPDDVMIEDITGDFDPDELY